jgi:hypothetical protein
MSPEKIGKDAGDIIGCEKTGIIASSNLDEILALDADCFCHMGDAIGKGTEPVELCNKFLERGTNVVSLSIFPWAHSESCPPEFRDATLEACMKGNSTAFFTGIDPGWATTDLAIAALGTAGRVDTIRLCELGYWGTYDAEFACREYFGFGKEKGELPLLISGGFLKEMWSPTVYEVADALGVEIDHLETFFESDCVDYDVETAFGTVKAGTNVVVHFELRGHSNGSPIVIVEHNDLCIRGVGGQWKLPHAGTDLAYRVEVRGDPDFDIEFSFDAREGLRLTANPVVNSIPAVVAASPGLKSPLDISRYASPIVKSRKMLARGRELFDEGR